jgi:hypothetical protein
MITPLQLTCSTIVVEIFRLWLLLLSLALPAGLGHGAATWCPGLCFLPVRLLFVPACVAAQRAFNGSLLNSLAEKYIAQKEGAHDGRPTNAAHKVTEVAPETDKCIAL